MKNINSLAKHFSLPVIIHCSASTIIANALFFFLVIFYILVLIKTMQLLPRCAFFLILCYWDKKNPLLMTYFVSNFDDEVNTGCKSGASGMCW